MNPGNLLYVPVLFYFCNYLLTIGFNPQVVKRILV